MSHPLRPPSERYAVCCSFPDSGSFCSQDGRHLSSSSSDDDNNPVFSISKSSANVLTSSPHQRDPAFARLEVQHSSEQNCELSTSQNNLLLTKQNLDLHNPSSQALSERWISSMQSWSSCSPQSRSSTPDTVIFKGSQPSNITQEKLPDSSKLASPPARTPSPLTPAQLTPAQLTPAQLTPAQLTPAQLTPLQNANKQFASSENQEDSLSNPYSPQFSPLRAKHISPLPPKELLCFTFPSPVSSSVSLEKFAAEDPLYAIKKYEMDASLDELLTDISTQNLELQFENQVLISPDFANSTPTCKPPLITSFSDPYLGVCCHCNKHFCKNNIDFRNLGTSKICEEGTMTSNVELVEIGVQTFSPIGSWWNLKRNNSNVGSQSILGSPPGSRLNLRSPVGSHSNLVSPSSSMFVMHSDEDEIKIEKEELSLETLETSNVGIVRRRSCLKIHDENRELGRRSSMKQVQWDEDGMTWDVHGAAIDPEELNMAIQKHLELKCNVEEEEKDVKTPIRKSSKKKRAPRPPVNLKPPVILIEGRRKEEWREEERRERKGEQIEEREEEEMRRGSQSPGIVQRKKSMIRPFKKPGCCGGSSKHNN